MSKKTIRNIIITGIIFLCTGIILTGISVFKYDTNITSIIDIWDNRKEIEVNETFNENLENIESLKLDLMFMNVHVRTGEQEEIIFHNIPKEKVNITKNDKHMEVSLDIEKEYKYKNMEVIVVLKEEHMLENFILNANMADVKIDSLRSKKAAFYLSMGNIETDKLLITDLILDNNMGEFEGILEDMNSIEIKNKMGDIHLDYVGNLNSFNYEIDTNMGTTEIGNDEYNEDTMIDNNSLKQINIENDMGTVIVKEK